MAEIHRTTMQPGKLDLLGAWLPAQPWYVGVTPELTRAGGFRLDDPTGKVGIEIVFVADGPGPDAVVYSVPLGYRGAPLDGADAALIGTSEHGVLGTRWVYDGAGDPVVGERLVALARGEAEPQHQSESDTPDPSVTTAPGQAGQAEAAGRTAVVLPGTVLELVRVLRPDVPACLSDGSAAVAGIEAGWRRADGTTGRGLVALLGGQS